MHSVLDREHADESRTLLAEHAGPSDTDRLVAVAERALAGNWRLLDGVEAHALAST